MKVFDLHCDTAARIYSTKESLWQNEGQLDLKRGQDFEQWVQTYAFFMDDCIQGEEAWQTFLRLYDYFESQREQTGLPLYQPSVTSKQSALLSIEGGGILGGQLQRIEQLAKKQIRMLTLTWNHQNEWASGALDQGGLTAFGRQGIALLEQYGILADVSHLNEQSFWDVTKVAKRPLVATHSNSFSVHPHVRNLTDDQVKAIVASGGIIGINYYPMFVNGQEDCTFEEFAKHIERFCTLGADKQLALGSDFDGATMPTALFSVKELEKYHAFMVKWFGIEFSNQLFFENAQRFFTEQWD